MEAARRGILIFLREIARRKAAQGISLLQLAGATAASQSILRAA
jgi:hypothetical protein